MHDGMKKIRMTFATPFLMRKLLLHRFCMGMRILVNLYAWRYKQDLIQIVTVQPLALLWAYVMDLRQSIALG